MRETEHEWQLAEAKSASLGPGTNTCFSSNTKWDLSNETQGETWAQLGSCLGNRCWDLGMEVR